MKLTDWLRTRRPSRVYYGWWLAAASTAMVFFAGGIFVRGSAAFFVPLKDALGISHRRTSLVFSMARAGGSLEGPVAGWLIDRYGTRKLVIGGVLIAGLGYFAFSRVDNFLWFALVYLIPVSVGNSIAFQHSIVAGLNMWFIRRRAFVLAVMASGAALGGVVMIPVMTLIIIKVSWEWAAVMAGCCYLVIVLPLAFFLRPSPESMGLLPDGDPPPESKSEVPLVGGTRAASAPISWDPREFTVPEALRTSAYWTLLLGIGLRQAVSAGILVNVQPILHEWKGISLETVGYLFALMMVVNVVSRLATGWAADKWSKARIMSGCMVLESLAIAFLLFGSWENSRWAIFLYLIVGGVGESVAVIIVATVGDYFGRRRFATLRGIMVFSHSWALIASPVFVGWWADKTQGYVLPLWIAIGVYGLASVCFAITKPPRRPLPKGVAPVAPGQQG